MTSYFKILLLVTMIIPLISCICTHESYGYIDQVVPESDPLIYVSAKPTKFETTSRSPTHTIESQPYLITIEVITANTNELIQIKVLSVKPSTTVVSPEYTRFNAEKQGWLKTREDWFSATKGENIGARIFVKNVKSDHQPLAIKFHIIYKKTKNIYDVVLQPDYIKERYFEPIHILGSA